MECQDCLIWIGSSYPSVREYVKEASTRGCCRQIPSWPSWAKPGLTRVFLAHRDGYAGPEKGSIFGYFVLHGVDVILTQNDCDQYKALATGCLPTPTGKKQPAPLKDFWKTEEGQQQLAPVIDFWRERVSGDRLPFKIPERDRRPPPVDDDLIDFVLDFLISCEPEGGADNHCGYGISTDQTSLEESRECGDDGLRTGPDKLPKQAGVKKHGGKAGPSFYFVDALTRWIDEFFCDLLKELIKAAIDAEAKKQKKRKGKRGTLSAQEIRDNYIADLKIIASEKKPGRFDRQKGIPEFQDAVRKAAKLRKSWTEIPSELKGIAEDRGALVLFRKPYPFYRTAPRAAFLGLMRIDGDELLHQITERYKRKDGTHEVTVPYCHPEPNTERHLVLKLAQNLRVNKEFAGRILDYLAELIGSELRERDRIRLNEIGTFKIRAKNGRRLIKFKASTVLRRNVALVSTPVKPETTDKRNVRARGSKKPARKRQTEARKRAK